MLSEQLMKQFVEKSGYLDKFSRKTLYDINSDLNKVISFLLQNKDIDEQSLEQLMSPADSRTIFDLENDILQEKTEETLRLYQTLELQDKSAKLALSLFRQFIKKISNYMKASYLLNQGYSQSTIAKELNVKPFYLTKALSLKKRYSYQEALCILNRLSDIDYRYKIGEIPTYLLGEMILFAMEQS